MTRFMRTVRERGAWRANASSTPTISRRVRILTGSTFHAEAIMAVVLGGVRLLPSITTSRGTRREATRTHLIRSGWVCPVA